MCVTILVHSREVASMLQAHHFAMLIVRSEIPKSQTEGWVSSGGRAHPTLNMAKSTLSEGRNIYVGFRCVRSQPCMGLKFHSWGLLCT